MSSTSSSKNTLEILLPHMSSEPPPELISLSASLLAQSRACAPNLRPEEEIARPYACAEIACRRLQSRLRLPATRQGRPPCPPKVYAKLVTYLEGVLGVRSPFKVQKGEQGSKRGGATPVKEHSTPKKDALKNRVGADQSPPSTPTNSHGKGHAFAGKIGKRKNDGKHGEESEAPEWTMSLIRRLCTTFATPLLPPHVYTGTTIVLTLAGLWPTSQGSSMISDTQIEMESQRAISSLLLGIYFMVYTKMQKGKMTPEMYAEKCQRAVEVVGEQGIDGVEKSRVDEWIKKMNAEGWCRGQQWWGSVPEDVMAPDSGNTGEEATDMPEDDNAVSSARKRRKLVGDEDQSESVEGVLLPGLGTMMQEAVDFLDEERKLDYIEWKDGVMSRIKQIEKGGGRRTFAVR